MDFVEEMNAWQEIALPGGETRSGLIDIEAGFPDSDGLLDTAYSFLRRLKCLPLKVVTRQAPTSVFEEYFLETAPGRCVISANDTEGIRRGIYRLAEMLQVSTPAELPVNRERITPKMRLRLGRYGFGSAKHPSPYDDFAPDFDFYPEPFLERMAASGINVLWFSARCLDDLCLNEWCPGKADEKRERYKHIRAVIERCRRYGIRLFAYMVIPAPIPNDHPLLQSHPQIKGPTLYYYNLFCVAHEGRRYLRDCARQLFSDLPGLGGLLAIVQGEGAAFCPDILECGGKLCNGECHLTAPEIYAAGISALFEGMRDANPSADLIAWFYLPFNEKCPDYLDKLVQLTSKEIIYQCNVESGAKPMQLGKPRPIGDYWQAFAGTAPVFDDFAAAVTRHGGRLGAKIQVGTSHEIGSVPYVPVPALTYRKYAALQRAGVETVMQGWKTGATPGFMNEAAGRLAFLDCTAVTEQEFLRELAQIEWGVDVADEAVRGWELLSEAFANYPYSNMIQYFGPVADGVTWPLYVQFVEKPMLSTWAMHGEETSGDTIWECLNNHTFTEAVQLLGDLARKWHEGAEAFRGLSRRIAFNRKQKIELGRIEALEILFGAAGRIFHFYQLRREYLGGDKRVLPAMRSIVHEEMAERRRLLPILDEDPVIGYNPEAHGNKFDRPSIERGLAALEQTLEDLDQAERSPVPPPVCHGIGILDGRLHEREKLAWSGTVEGGQLKLLVRCPGHCPIDDELFIAFDDKGEHGPIIGHLDCLGHIFVFPEGCTCRIESDDDGWQAAMVFPTSALPGGNPGQCRFNVTRLLDDYEHRCSWPGAVTDYIIARLNLAFYDSRDMGDLRMP